ncbi:MAG: low molecular weight protein-tyrosine-phosphatase [Porcipelethomonas sp.]
MTRIMFVCHGNICRSPMAEFIMKKLVRDSGAQDSFCIDSSATSTEEIRSGKGKPVYPPAKAELKKHGISCEGKYAVHLKKSDYDKYDYLIGMDSANIRNMQRILGNDKNEKIYKLLSFAGRSDDVADPWYSGDFETTYRDIYEGCSALLKHLNEREQKSPVHTVF